MKHFNIKPAPILADPTKKFGLRLMEECFSDAKLQMVDEFSHRMANEPGKRKGSKACRVSGTFVTDHLEVDLVITIPSNFRKNSPTVSVNLYDWFVDKRGKLPAYKKRINGWLKCSSDWHCGKNGTLCWVLHKEWEYIHQSADKPISLVIEDGVLMLQKDVSVLLHRHKMGHVEKRRKWPKHWTEWRHYEDGVEQFREEMRLHGKPENWSNIQKVA